MAATLQLEECCQTKLSTLLKAASAPKYCVTAIMSTLRVFIMGKHRSLDLISASGKSVETKSRICRWTNMRKVNTAFVVGMPNIHGINEHINVVS